jgi:hypothetical protein
MEKQKISIEQDNKSIPLDKYAGEWVAFLNGKVVAHQSTLQRLMKKVGKLKKKLAVFLVPKKREWPYI